MRILFLNPPFGSKRPEGLDAPLGIMSLGAALKGNGHECSLVDNVWEKTGDWSKWNLAIRTMPDFILINTQIRFSDDTEGALHHLRQFSIDIPVIAFGPQASTEARHLLDMGFDACIVGEPEEVIFDIIDDIQNNRAILSRRGVATNENELPGTASRVNIDRLPSPDRELVDYGRYIKTTYNAVLIASRGLDHLDGFSQPPLIYALQPTIRFPIKSVIAELEKLRNKYCGPYMVLFHDEVFTEDRKWVVDLCEKLKEMRFNGPYWCFTRPDMMDEELGIIMKASGFVGVSMGMESGSDRVLNILGRNITVSQIVDGFKSVRNAGLLSLGSVMIGTPGNGGDPVDETTEEIEMTVELVKNIKPDILTITLTTPLPGTSLHDALKGRILAKSPADFNYYDVWPGKYPIHLKHISADDLSKYVLDVRSAWEKGLIATAWRILKIAVLNSAYRGVLINQIFKVMCAKVFLRRNT